MLSWIVICAVYAPYQLQAEEASERARQALALGHISEAVDLLQAQVKLSSADYQSWFLLGVAQARSKHFHQAIEAFRRVSELRTDLSEPHNNLAVIYNELGDVNAAVMELRQSLKKQPNDAVVEENIADLYIKLALDYYKSALVKHHNTDLEQRYERLLRVRDNQSDSTQEKTALPRAASMKQNTAGEGKHP